MSTRSASGREGTRGRGQRSTARESSVRMARMAWGIWSIAGDQGEDPMAVGIFQDSANSTAKETDANRPSERETAMLFGTRYTSCMQTRIRSVANEL